MQHSTCANKSVSRRDFLHLPWGCALAVAAFGEAFANPDPIRVVQASGGTAGG